MAIEFKRNSFHPKKHPYLGCGGDPPFRYALRPNPQVEGQREYPTFLNLICCTLEAQAHLLHLYMPNSLCNGIATPACAVALFGGPSGN